MATQTPTSEYARALAENDRYGAQFDRSALPLPPGRKLAVLACMDARLTVEDVLGLRTEEVIVVEHTGCGMLTFQDADVHADLVAKTGADIEPAFHAFPDLESNLRAQVERIREHPWIKDVPVHGLI